MTCKWDKAGHRGIAKNTTSIDYDYYSVNQPTIIVIWLVHTAGHEGLVQCYNIILLYYNICYIICASLSYNILCYR